MESKEILLALRKSSADKLLPVLDESIGFWNYSLEFSADIVSVKKASFILGKARLYLHADDADKDVSVSRFEKILSDPEAARKIAEGNCLRLLGEKFGMQKAAMLFEEKAMEADAADPAEANPEDIWAGISVKPEKQKRGRKPGKKNPSSEAGATANAVGSGTSAEMPIAVSDEAEPGDGEFGAEVEPAEQAEAGITGENEMIPAETAEAPAPGEETAENPTASLVAGEAEAAEIKEGVFTVRLQTDFQRSEACITATGICGMDSVTVIIHEEQFDLIERKMSVNCFMKKQVEGTTMRFRGIREGSKVLLKNFASAA